jgi:hypothetical protein
MSACVYPGGLLSTEWQAYAPEYENVRIDAMIKNEKKVEFKIADYAYMDDMPMNGWLWEFIRRSEAYKNRFNELHKG